MKQTVVYMIIVALIGMLLTLWVVITGQDSTPFIDEKIVAFVQPLNETPLYDIARWLTKLGSKIFLVPFTIVMSGVFLWWFRDRSEEHTSELQSRGHLVCRLLLEKKK